MGKRLKFLRGQAGLTQSEVARRLGRTGPGGKSWVSQLENGRLPEVRLGDVLEFLRICGRGFDAMLDVTDAYTSLPTVEEERVRQAAGKAVQGLPYRLKARIVRYDTKLAARFPKARSVEQRVRQAERQARAVRWEHRLHRTWNEVLNELHVGCSDPLAVHLWAYGQKVFATLRRIRSVRPVWRDKAVAKLDT